MKTLKYALRFLMRSKSYTIINLLGLAFSLACCIILMRYIHRELTVDTHCIDPEHVIIPLRDIEGNIFPGNLQQENSGADSAYIPEDCIVEQCRIIVQQHDNVVYDNSSYTMNVLAADSTFFHFFRYPMAAGTARLEAPDDAIIARHYARRIFGNENPVGKVMQFNGKSVIIRGVADEPGCKTLLQFDMLVSFQLMENWRRMHISLMRVLPSVNPEAINLVSNVYRKDSRGNMIRWKFVNWKEFYWDKSIMHHENYDSIMQFGNRTHLYILSGVAFLLLLVGILNFINIYMVFMMKRSKEYGVKKVFGACGRTLFANIWIENTLLVLGALSVAWLIIEMMSIPTEYLFNIRFSYTAFDGWLSIGILLLLPMITSIYPYIKYNYTSPILSIRSIGWGSHSVHTRMFFLGAQYIMTFLLVVFSLYFNRQLGVLLNTEPGFRTKNIMNVNLVYESKDYSSYTYESIQERRQRIMQLDNELKTCPFIEVYEPSREGILTSTFGTNYLNDKGEKVFLNVRYATPAFFKLYHIQVMEGSIPDIKREDQRTVFVVNRAALKALGYPSINGAGVIEENQKRADANAALQPIIAVVEDYFEGHLTSGVHPTIYPVGAWFSGDLYQIAYTPGKKKEVIDFLRKLEYKVYGSEDFEYTLLENDIKAMYEQDRQTATIYSIFASIAIIVSSLGLLGISLFDIRQRYREIAIRKVNGAGLKDLYQLLYRKYMIVLIIAFAIAIPLSYYLINMYTQDFAVKAPIDISIFIISLLLVMVISLGTLTWQIRKAANIDPAKIIKTE